jgi:hypothetical protein
MEEAPLKQPSEPLGLERVRDFMINMCRMSEGRGWATLSEIEEMTGVHEAYVSVNLQHLCKTRYGSHIVDKRHRQHVGTYEYRVRERAKLGASPVSQSRGSRGRPSASYACPPSRMCRRSGVNLTIRDGNISPH